MTEMRKEPWFTSPDGAHGWIQWKGTAVCMDVRCVCGELSHLDADFAYSLKCPSCGRLYVVDGHVRLHEVAELPGWCAEPKEPVA